MPQPRNLRVVELLRAEVVKALGRVKDPRLQGLLTITEVTLSPDLKNAEVFFSVLGTDKEIRSTQRALESAKKFIRGEVGRHLKLRIVPDIHFSRDDTPKKASRLEKLLNDLKKE